MEPLTNIASSDFPYKSLNADNLIPVSDEIAASSSKSGLSTTRSQVHTGRFGVWVQILENVYDCGLGDNLDHSQDGKFVIDEAQTTFLKPAAAATKSYIRQSLEAEGMKEYFEGSRFRKTVYMIGGLKIANGAKVSIDTAKSKEVVAKLMLGGTAARVPMKQDCRLRCKWAGDEAAGWKDMKRFVSVYRLRKITYKKGW